MKCNNLSHDFIQEYNNITKNITGKRNQRYTLYRIIRNKINVEFSIYMRMTLSILALYTIK